MSAPNQTTPAGWYVWTCPGYPLRILVSLAVVERLGREIAAKARREETGGLLIGNKRSGVTRITEYIPLPADPNSASDHFVLSTRWLNEVIARCPSDSKVVGYYRSDRERLIRLRDDDLEVMLKRFKDPSNVCMVMAPSSGVVWNAGFFSWRGGELAVNPSLTFPLSAVELVANEWPLELGLPWSERIGRLFSSLPHALLRSSEAKVAIQVAGVTAVLAVVITFMASRWVGSGDAPPGLGLQVRGDGTKFLLSWNRSSEAIQKAKDANLVIWDASRADSDGNTEPLHLPVPLPRLRSGSLTYSAFEPTSKVRFRLDVTEESGSLRSESATSLSTVQALKEEQPSLRRAKAPRQIARRELPARLPDPGEHKIAARKFAPPQAAPPPATIARVIIPEPPPAVSTGSETQARIASIATVEPPSLRAPPAETQAPSAAVRPTPSARPANPSSAGMVTITSEPSGAEVQVNAIPAGVTPVTIQISPVGLGFTVTVAKQGYVKWSLQTFATEKPYALHAQLKESR